jgi:hypothetical protein
MSGPTPSWLPRHLSVSSVELYARCPAQWKRRYIDKADAPTVPMVWGSAFHKALEAAHNGESAELAWVRAWNETQAEVAARGEMLAPGKTHGLALLDEFERRGLNAVCPAEVKFLLPFPSGKIVHPRTRKSIPLLGYADAFHPEETREYKTSAGGWWSEVKAQLAHQTHVYGWARQRTLHHRRPMRYVIFGTRRPTVTEYLVEPSPDGMRLFEKLAEGVWDGIVNARYDGCGTCDLCVPRDAVDGALSFDLEGIS